MDTMKRSARALRALTSILALGTMLTFGCSDPTTTTTEPTNIPKLDPPPAGQGFQVTLGPFDVPAGTEIQRNYYQKLPNDADIYVTKIEFKYSVGSHHLILYKTDSNIVDHVEETFDLVNFEKLDMVAASQRRDFTWTLPPGVAIKLKAHQQMDFQTHYVNAATQGTPGNKGTVLINFWTTDKANVTAEVGTIFSSNKQIHIPPHTSATWCKVIKPQTHDINILLLTGHYHSRGKTFTIGHWDGVKLTDTIYRSADWDEPPITHYNPGYLLRAGDSIAFVSTYENRTNLDLKFGAHFETQEHANVFQFYYPQAADGKAVYDFEGGILMEQHPI